MGVEPRPAKKGWMWFFLILAVLGAVAIGLPLLYNLSQQLTEEKLKAARTLWEENGPADYTVLYEIRRQSESDGEADRPAAETFIVKVIGGHVISVSRKDEPSAATKGYSVDALFDLIEHDLHTDNHSGGAKTYLHAQFDKKDGHPIHYVRRILGTRERIEWIIKLTPGSDAEKSSESAK